jgi:NAD(P)-dependent dehydrogenase (short-subunit alcohol dehydrogenase family)
MTIKPKTNRIALVTRAEQGLGQELAEQLAQAGLHVIVGGRDLQAVRRVVAAIREAGGQADALALDTGNPESIQQAARAIHSYYGRLDVLVNVAGLVKEASWDGNTSSVISSEVLYETFETNFFGVVALTQALWPSLEKSQHASVVNVSSVLGPHTIYAQTNGSGSSPLLVQT